MPDISVFSSARSQTCAADIPGFPPASAHLVGIGGSGMKALAEILVDLHCRVTGSDIQSDSAVLRDLRQRVIRIDSGHRPEQVPPDAQMLVFSPAIPVENPERQQAAKWHIPQSALPEVLQRLMRDRTGIGIAGTHGKSTTTALIAWILRCAGRSPSAYLGATVRQLGRSGWIGQGTEFVVECCEFQRNFLQLPPRHAVILDVEPDHWETYPDETSLFTGFTEFARRITREGVLLVSGDCPRSLRAATAAGVAYETFGSTRQADWHCDSVRWTPSGMRFCVFHHAACLTQIELPLFGEHNVHNATAAVAMCSRLEVPTQTIREALRTFPGIGRRFEPIGLWRGAVILDDYAHHPTAVRVTLETARRFDCGGRLWCVFQPHQVRRVQRMTDAFVNALALADRVMLTPVYSAREHASTKAEACSQLLARRIQSRGIWCRYCQSLDRILPTLEDEAQPGDVVVLMGAGDIERIGHEFAGRVS